MLAIKTLIRVNLRITLWVLIFLIASHHGNSQSRNLKPVNFSDVNIVDQFWKPKIEKVATKTLAACIYQTETATPRIRNFEKVARKKGEKHEGIYYDDSDVYKALEAIAYALKTRPDPVLENKADEWIDKIAAAQLPDGYLNTYYTLNGLDKRWSDIEKHEDYNAGHLIEAAIAYFNTTGKKKLLEVAIRLANHIDSNFRLQNKPWFSGHQEIELALMKLYRLTSEDRYLKLADWYLQQRGKGYYTYGKNWIRPDYWQDQFPVKDQKEITGHAVRAMYQFSGVADVAAVTGDELYLAAARRVWQDVVYRNMYITGGIGSAGDNEGFSIDYDLPNEEAYCETCASVGMVFWNQRMNSLTGESKYIDVLEKAIYNGALDGLSLSGDRFFYDNPLASMGQHSRREWFGTACCPANIARLVSSVGNYIYATSNDAVWVNLFIASNTSINLNGILTGIKMETNYPWDGRIKIHFDPSKKSKFGLKVRIPGWTKASYGAEELYISNEAIKQKPKFFLNGKPIDYREENGYGIIEREWKRADVIEFEFPMHVIKMRSRSEVAENKDRVALQYGPLIYCIEGADNGGKAWNFIFPDSAIFSPFEYKILDEPVIALKGMVKEFGISNERIGLKETPKQIIAIPYYTWANRGANQMQVWLPTRLKEIKVE